MSAATPRLVRFAQRSCQWAERWYPESFVFAVATLAVVALGAWLHGTGAPAVAWAFGEGFWSLVPFTLQMAFIIIGGYVTADSPPVAALIRRLAGVPRTGRGAILLVAVVGLLLALLHWALAMIVASLLVRALARRESLGMDYRAAGAAAYIAMGAVTMLGLSSSAAQLQANPASMPEALLRVTGVIPFSETLFLWQSGVLVAAMLATALAVVWATAPTGEHARTARQLGIDLGPETPPAPARERPGDWLEFSPLPSLLVVLLGGGWLVQEFARKGAVQAISSLNTYNLLFLLLGFLLQWRPRRFLDAVARAVPGVAGVLLLFPLYGGIAAIIKAPGAGGATLSQALSHAFTSVASTGTFAPILAVYSAVLGMFIPSAGGKWIVEAPYVMQAANELHFHLGWAVQVYNCAEALPNLVNPFWMLPILGLLGLKARDLIGYTLVQFLVLAPVAIALLWWLGSTLAWHPPVMP